MRSDSLLIAAWYFPPDGGAGSQRPASFARELPGLGWDTTVVTRGTGHDRGRWETRDDSLLAGLDRVRLERVEVDAPPTAAAGPLPPEVPPPARALAAHLIRTAERDRPSVVLLTMSPFFLAALIEPLRVVCDARIVVDLRDPWALDYWPVYSSRRRLAHQRRAMLDCLERADGIVMNTELARTELLSRHGSELGPDLESRTTVVPNGFDRSDLPVTPASVPEDVLEIVHVGTFHCEHLPAERGLRDRIAGLRRASRLRIDRTGRTPHHLFRAAAELGRSSPDFARDVRFRFIGSIDPPLERCVRDSGLADRTTLDGYRPHREIVESMRTAGALFLPGAGLPPGTRELIVPGKTYEYLASGRPILAAIAPGDARSLVESAGGGYVCDPCSVGSIADALRRLHADWSGGAFTRGVARDRTLVDAFERGRLAAALSEHLRTVRELPPRRA